MYLSRLYLNPWNGFLRTALADIHVLHRAVMLGFGPDAGEARVLYRLEDVLPGGWLQLLVQSLVVPQWERLDERGLLAPSSALPVEPARWIPYSADYPAGAMLLFHLRANPTCRRRGKRRAWESAESQLQWLTHKAAGGGFRLQRVRVRPERIAQGLRRHGRECDRLRLYSAFFEGILQVEDPALLARTIRSGIGSGKAFGFGLLSAAALTIPDTERELRHNRLKSSADKTGTDDTGRRF